ncbi:MAG: hypothetical protein L6Q98_24650 [Anaerolineae bacterium]|nr:hypothetical protein [Anaerolineae bacterium]NUQ07168.1 DNA translocase FtsK [Anaerolineae bacterium]
MSQALSFDVPEPLAFLKDYIADENKMLLKREADRWRYLTWRERLMIRGHVRRLAAVLKHERYNELIILRAELLEQFNAARQTYEASHDGDEQRAAAKAEYQRIKRLGHVVHARLMQLKPVASEYRHYTGWLDYERKNRKVLKTEAKREKMIRKNMRRENKVLEKLIIGVWKRIPTCHYMEKNDKGRERAIAPKFARGTILPDAHYFWLKVSSRWLFGWRPALPYGVLPHNLIDEHVLDLMRAATTRQVDALHTDQRQIVIRVSRTDSPDALPTKVRWIEAMSFYNDKLKARYGYTVGVSEGRKFEWFGFVDNPHILVGGKSQSGKSNLTNGIVASLVSTHSPAELRLVMIDMKGGIEYSHWGELPHLLWEMVSEHSHVAPTLERLINVMQKREAMLKNARKKDIAAYNTTAGDDQQLPRIVLLIDELNEFVGMGAETERIHTLIARLTSKGRAVGIHVVASTQYPEVKVVPGRIKTNMDVRVSGAMPTIVSSHVILDNPEAARIPAIPGRMVVSMGLRTIVVQAPLITDEDIAMVVASSNRLYTDVPNELAELADAPQLVVWDEARMIRACMELLEGHLGAQKLHQMLGSESPGERHLSKLVRGIRDRSEALGYIEAGEARYKVKKLKRGYYLEPLLAQTDSLAAQSAAGEASD